jgi:glycerate dehydrogenase
MRQINAVVLDIDTLHPDDLDLGPLLKMANVRWRIHPCSTPQQAAKRMAGADIVLTNKVPIGAREIEAAPMLKYIGVLATGTNIIDLKAVRARNISITNITNYGTASVVQHTFALILALTTKLSDYSVAASDGRWASSDNFCLLDFPVRELDGLTLGIIGYGVLGQAVANAGKAFGMDIVAATLPGRHSATREVRRLPLTRFLSSADIVSIHCPLADNTRDLIDDQELGLMKPSALLINCARGGVVNEQALANALKGGAISGAGLDVLGDEPPPHDHILFDADIPNLIITPHCAWGARQARQRLVNQAEQHLRTWLASL